MRLAGFHLILCGNLAFPLWLLRLLQRRNSAAVQPKSSSDFL